MIILVTGAPGCGKTSYVVNLLDTLPEYKNRPVYVSGIPELILPHEEAGPMDKWHEWAPDGALVVYDECQTTFRPRPNGSQVPDHIAKFETHRHRGLDFYLITQHPNLIDQNVRRLVGKHIHVRRHALGGEILEWSEVSDPNSKSARASAIRSRYKPPKNSFGKYKSATIHTKHKFKLPMPVYIAAALFPVFLYLTYKNYHMIQTKIHPEQYKDELLTAENIGKTPGAAVLAAPAAAPGQLPTKPVEPIDQYQAAVPGRPETAPMYQPLLQVKSFPWPSACIQSGDRCTCYTQQASRIPEISTERCQQILKGGKLFNPYANPDAQPSAPPLTAT